MAMGKRSVRIRKPFMQAFRDGPEKVVAGRRTEPEGEQTVAGRGRSSAALTDETSLLRLVRADLEHLLNTVNMASTQRLDDYPEVAGSILNYGIPDIAHRTIEDEGVNQIVGEIETAIRIYEPRIPRRSVVVHREANGETGELRVRFRVAAEVRMTPENLPIEFIADVEVDSGRVVLKRV